MSKVSFTAGRINQHTCPADKKQCFIWDINSPGLGLRTTPSGSKCYIFQGKLSGNSIRVSIGDSRTWTIDQAQAEARRLQRLIDEGKDPRAVKAELKAEQVAKAAAEIAKSVTVAEAWAVYVEERKPHWGERHYLDNLRKVQAGGQPAIRGTRGRGIISPGPLYPLMKLRLVDLTPSIVDAWAEREAKTRPTSGRLSLRLLKAFVSWCTEHEAYAAVVSEKAAKSKKARKALGPSKAKKDALLREQLPAWFAAVRQVYNPVVSAYLQVLLLTGARPGEILEMRWEDLNVKWRGMVIRDKVEGSREIPITPYVEYLLAALPRRSEFVFSSSIRMPGKPHQPISKPHEVHHRACQVAGIDGLTLHGLRRSFKSLSEWLECPAGVVAQIMGHKPSATVERHYVVRPLDLLRVHHERLEAWILEQAGVEKISGLTSGLRVVQGGI